MQIVPVVDIRNGVAVRAVAGNRGLYQPVKSQLADSAEPAIVLTALQKTFRCRTCYVADLDAIERQQLNCGTIAEMVRTGVSLIMDGGVTTVEQIEGLFELGVDRVVLSSESINDLTQLESMIEPFEPASLIFSIDLKNRNLLVSDPCWDGKPPIEMARFVFELGLRQLIVLDLAAVGTGNGVPTLELCQQIKSLSSEITIISGGGVASGQCVAQAARAGLDGLLIASALHDGRLTKEDLAAYWQAPGNVNSIPDS
jgi:phosphoribosylformimino-5-aminoimidazole carboxamide ribotide isomerase